MDVNQGTARTDSERRALHFRSQDKGQVQQQSSEMKSEFKSWHRGGGRRLVKSWQIFCEKRKHPPLHPPPTSRGKIVKFDSHALKKKVVARYAPASPRSCFFLPMIIPPLLAWLEFPAVVDPSFLNTGFSPASFSAVVPARMPSSLDTSTSRSAPSGPLTFVWGEVRGKR